MEPDVEVKTKKRHTAVGGESALKVSGFDIRERLGAGGSGVVWKAYQVSLDRVVAIKVLRPEFAANPAEVSLFMDEARAAAKLSHPNIVQVYDTGFERGTYYFVMEYVPGRTVGHILRTQGAMPFKKALRIITSVGEALDYAWRKAEMVHRDVKPDNIIIEEDEAVKLTDLGLASVGRPHARQTEETEAIVEGTPNFMAPEQADGLPADCRSDIYAAGATLYHMVTGKMPFKELASDDILRAQVEAQLDNPRDINPQLPLSISQLLSRMMMKNPADRPADWPEALREIKRVASGRVLLMQSRDARSTIAQPWVTGGPAADTPPVNSGGADDVPASWRGIRMILLIFVWFAFALWMAMPLVYKLLTAPRL